MTQSRHTYDPTSPEAVEGLKTYLNAANKAEETGAAYPSPEALLVGLPQGPIKAARVTPEELIAFNIRDRNERFIEPEGFTFLRILILLGGGVYIDKDRTGGPEYHYPELFGGKDAQGKSLGITLQRLLTDAQRGERVRLNGDHHYLTAANFRLERGPKSFTRGRPEAHAAAINEYDKHAVRWGLAETLSRDAYHGMLSEAFRLYDLKYGHHHLRAIDDQANTTPAA
jgi:hypothetical protein